MDIIKQYRPFYPGEGSLENYIETIFVDDIEYHVYKGDDFHKYYLVYKIDEDIVEIGCGKSDSYMGMVATIAQQHHILMEQ